jgi:hypothetical protein
VNDRRHRRHSEERTRGRIQEMSVDPYRTTAHCVPALHSTSERPRDRVGRSYPPLQKECDADHDQP